MSITKHPAVASIEPEFLRTRDVARVLAVSERQVQYWTRAGTLRAISIPGIRAKRFRRADVERLAAEWAESA
jgi:excisionase family DNA binding protein